jgi:PhnB protein
MPQNALSPYLIVNNAVEALAFYAKAFQAKELFRLTGPDGKVGHAELELGGGRFMIADEYPDFGALSPATVGGTPVTLHLYVENVDQFIARAAKNGASVLRPAKDEFFGDRTGTIVDPFGHKWQIATRKENVSPKEMQRRWTAMFQQ